MGSPTSPTSGVSSSSSTIAPIIAPAAVADHLNASAAPNMTTSPSSPSTPPSPTSPPPITAAAAAAASTQTSRSTSATLSTPTPCARHRLPSEVCEACLSDRPYVARIRSPSHVVLAIRLLFTDPTRRRDLFTNWIHVPLGITSLLVLVWLIKQGMDRAPFRFPSPVIAMLLLFVLLLLLDYLSTTQWVKRTMGGREGKVLLRPALAVLEAPCDFCLRYMSVMFTPSFILIPAREIINGREIGLITGWFAASQIAALVFPVLLHRLVRVVVATCKHHLQQSRDKRSKAKRVDETRRASVATLVAVISQINPETTVEGGEKLGSIATGLSGMTAIATAPLTLNTAVARRGQRGDAQRQLEHVQLETARQQGDPYATAHSPVHAHHHHYPLSSAPNTPAHNHRLHQTAKDGYFSRGRGLELDHATGDGMGRSRSLARSWVAARGMSPSAARRPGSGNGGKGRFGAAVVGTGSGLKYSTRRPQSANAASQPDKVQAKDEALSPTFDEYIFQARRELIDRRRSSIALAVDPKGEEETLVMPTRVAPTPTRGSQEILAPKAAKLTDEIEAQPDKEKAANTPSQQVAASTPVEEQLEGGGEETDAIDHLIDTLWLSIPWLVFALLLVAGLPLFYTLDISLPLFLSINLLTFLAAITLVPARIRRYAHPILTTSIATVLVLWALGAMRGWSLRRTLSSYSVDAKYTVLWSLSGYTGPVIGAGDVLFSTLDAGIVSLAIPMYRYRWDLWFHLADMLVVLFPCSLLSLFVWPTVAGAIGIAPQRALAFASRFMSTPLAIELSLTIGADESITVVLVVITGIVISIFKDPFFGLFGLNPDRDGPTEGEEGEKGQEEKGGERDYLTIGIAMGSTAGAIGASSLISKPRSMAIASLSFVLFGAILLIFAAIPPVVETLRGLAGAPLVFTPAS